MNIKEFWMDVLRAAAIIGVVMALSHVIEQYILFYSSMSLYNASMALMVEWFISTAAFAGLLYYFMRRVALAWNDRVEVGDGIVVEIPFTYTRAVSYGLIASMLVGLFVGVIHILFVDYMGGFDLYRTGQLAYFEEVKSLMGAYNEMLGVEVMPMDNMDATTEQIENMEQPSMFWTIISQMSSFMLYGGVVSLIVAAIARRKPKAQNISNE